MSVTTIIYNSKTDDSDGGHKNQWAGTYRFQWNMFAEEVLPPLKILQERSKYDLPITLYFCVPNLSSAL